MKQQPRIYILGGYDGENALDTNEIFLPGNQEESWQKGTPLPQASFGFGIASFVDVIYLIGGKDGSGGTQISYQYRPQEDLWEPFESLQGQIWSHMALQPLGSLLYIWGGDLGDVQSDKLWSYQVIYTLDLPLIQQ